MSPLKVNTPDQSAEKQVSNIPFKVKLVWPSGKALGWQVEGPRFNTALALLSLQKGCGL